MSEGHTNPAMSGQGQFSAPPQGEYSTQSNYRVSGETVSVQPVAGGQQASQWMSKPQGFAGCPPGLEYLIQVDQLVVKQQIELLEVLTGWEQRNKYRILNSVGQQVFFAAEESEMCMRQCCGPARAFVMHILDNAGQEVIRVNREFKCCAGCCWCAGSDGCAFTITVEAPVGTVVGHIRQEASSWKPHFSVHTADHGKVGVIRGPCCQCSAPCCTDVEFTITNAPSEDTKIGAITKKWTGCGVECLTNADTFSVSFPMDMDVRTKAVFVGAMFLIDFMYFEYNNQ